jgi:hypothetical protein
MILYYCLMTKWMGYYVVVRYFPVRVSQLVLERLYAPEFS